jgi:hypothetical protein
VSYACLRQAEGVAAVTSPRRLDVDDLIYVPFYDHRTLTSLRVEAA